MKLHILGLGALLVGGGTVSAQIVGKELARSAAHYDMPAARLVAQAVLDRGRQGDVQMWSESGKTGKVHLLDGGGASKCGRVRLTGIHRGVETHGYIFRYCRNAAGDWRTLG
ncbi:hypothetical protein KZX46_01305 (plasmid) [Polymorphobacter sp. PAMC 29334]|uniref:hypothetical protein n=1 Tax=Polymorphobacter sp. PAMC 29334 TaxID=2862331 RepID=UPI001C76DC9E|nr:hypothetical protein [Polymorphobacter sp. PAMC 29334]QYE33447.1 hypothetical protein KZX46_01305 [Polymorphobacter sp. PAMC 29334]